VTDSKQNILNVMGIDTHIFEHMSELCSFAIHNPGLYISLAAEGILSNCKEFNHILRKPSSYCYVDGIGAVVAIRSLHGVKAKKLPGCELWLDILEKTSGSSVAMIGSTPDVLTDACTKVSQEYDCNIVYQQHGYFENEELILSELSIAKPQFIFLALGQPKQEILGDKIRELLPQSSVFGVGGSFDVYCGKSKRAPKLFILLGLEWLYRLLKEPSRWKRQLVIPKLLGRALPLFIKRKLFDS